MTEAINEEETPEGALRRYLDRLRQLKEVHTVQGQDGNWNSDRYMRGMFNGMELALAIMEGRAPSYKDTPMGYLHEPDEQDFDRSLQHLLNYHGWDNACNTQDFLLSEFLQSVLAGLKKVDERKIELRSVPMDPEEAFRASYQSEEESNR